MARRGFLALALVGALVGAAAATTTTTSTTTSTTGTAAAIPVAGPSSSSATTYGSFLECLQNAPEGYSVVRSLMPRYLASNAAAWANPDLALTVFVPSDAAFEKFWKLKLDDMKTFPIEQFRSAFTPFVKYSILQKALSPEDMAVGASEPTWFSKQKPGSDLRFVPGAAAGAKAGGAREGGPAAAEPASSSVAVRARYSLAPLTSVHLRCGKGWAHGVDSLLLF